jgi:hypothetical protein
MYIHVQASSLSGSHSTTFFSTIDINDDDSTIKINNKKKNNTDNDKNILDNNDNNFNIHNSNIRKNQIDHEIPDRNKRNKDIIFKRNEIFNINELKNEEINDANIDPTHKLNKSVLKAVLNMQNMMMLRFDTIDGMLKKHEKSINEINISIKKITEK